MDGEQPIIQFKPVFRQGAHVIITAFGESGCGKTLSLLRLGRGLAGATGRLAMIDTENGRGRIYANSVSGGYDYGELSPPFTPERYVQAIEAAEAAGVDVLMIDSGSHEWEGFGGILEMADEGRDSHGKPYAGLIKWAKPKARHKRYVQRLLDTRMHLLISLRAKEKMIQLSKPPFPPGTKSGDIISDGYVSIQDKRFIYETTVQLFFPTKGVRGVPVTEQGPLFKCPEDLLAAFPAGEQINEGTGQRISEWVAGGTPVDHGMAAMKRDAEAEAGRGTVALQSFYDKLSREDKAKFWPANAANLKSIAASADRDIAERGPPPSDEQDEAPFANPQMPASADAPPATPQDDTAGSDAPTGEAGASLPATPGPTATTPASPSERDPWLDSDNLTIAPPARSGRPDWPAWSKLFFTKTALCVDGTDLALIIGHNQPNIDAFKAALGPIEAQHFDGAIAQLYQKLP